jgi:hypothetical protein
MATFSKSVVLARQVVLGEVREISARSPRGGLIFLAASVASILLRAQGVDVRSGNVFYSDGFGSMRQITFDGGDSQASLSPDGKTIVFVRSTGVAAGFDEPRALNPVRNELWIADVRGTNAPMAVFKGIIANGDLKYATFFAPRLAPGGRYAYFLIGWAAVEDAVVRVDLMTGKAKVITTGGDLRVISDGKYAGNLVVQKRKSNADGTSYSFYLVSSDGKELRLVGETEKKAEAFLDNASRVPK